jgi:hypothetical protein
VARDAVEAMDEQKYPALTEMARAYAMQPRYDFGDQFGPSLQLVLDSVERLRPADPSPGR